MANQSKLKAWVRYDGTGRVISGGPIFQVNKPKVGNWKQIDANLCCNNGSTTTTTTTGGGGGTPTAFIKGYFLNTFNACNSTVDGNLLFYSSSSTLQAGITVFTDAALTTPVTSGFVILNQPQPMQYVYYLVGQGGVLSLFTCPEPTTTTTTTTEAPTVFTVENQRWGNTANDACTGVNPLTTFYTTGPLQFGAYLQDGNVIYLDQALTQPVQYPYIVSPGITRLLDCSNGLLSNQRNC